MKAMVISQNLVNEVIEGCTAMEEYESFVLNKIKQGQSIIGLYPPTNPKVQEEFDSLNKI